MKKLGFIVALMFCFWSLVSLLMSPYAYGLLSSIHALLLLRFLSALHIFLYLSQLAV